VPLLTRRSTIDLLRTYGLRPHTGLGQHFLVDPNTIRKIIRLAGVGPGDRVLEVGAGLGALTIALAQTGAGVVAVEQDRSLAAPLDDVLAEVRDRVRVVWGDALSVDYGRLVRGGRWSMVSNLPYNIATPLLLDLLEHRPAIERYVVMVQREAGLRLVAVPGADGYGAVSAKIAYLAEARVVSKISRRVFLPEPAVESVLVELIRRSAPPVRVAKGRLFALIDAAFAQRRKTIRNTLRAAAGDVEGALAAAGVRAGARAEELALEDFARLAERIKVRATR
jgi:16S rRNA (adenine1518-N6/adenine1519-N6)-dimethyltransferase